MADPTFFQGHAAAIYTNLKVDGKLKQQVIGQFGILHPTVLKKFDLS